MRKLAIFSVKVLTENGDSWSRSFIGRPDNAEVVEAIEADLGMESAKLSANIEYLTTLYSNFRTLILDHGVPVGAKSVCKYAGVVVGHIWVSKVRSVFDMKAIQ